MVVRNIVPLLTKAPIHRIVRETKKGIIMLIYPYTAIMFCFSITSSRRNNYEQDVKLKILFVKIKNVVRCTSAYKLIGFLSKCVLVQEVLLIRYPYTAINNQESSYLSVKSGQKGN